MTSLPGIAIIGPGTLGKSIAIVAKQHGVPIVGIASRVFQRAQEAAEMIGDKALACSPDEAASRAGLIFLTVPDDFIEELCINLASVKAFTAGSVVVHCSGALSSDTLASARDQCGSYIASAHPLQTFPTVGSGVQGLSQSYWFCEGDKEALQVVQQLISLIGATPVTISAQHKMLYHCAAAMACNFLTTLLDVTLELAQAANIDRHLALKALQPLMQATLANVVEFGPEKALTGPIARGDVNTVRKHWQALECYSDSGIQEIYRALALRTVELAVRKGSLDECSRAGLLDVLSYDNNRR